RPHRPYDPAAGTHTNWPASGLPAIGSGISAVHNCIMEQSKVSEYRLPAQISPVAQSRLGFVILIGPLGHLYSVDLIIPDHSFCKQDARTYLAENRSGILFSLAARCLL